VGCRFPLQAPPPARREPAAARPPARRPWLAAGVGRARCFGTAAAAWLSLLLSLRRAPDALGRTPRALSGRSAAAAAAMSGDGSMACEGGEPRASAASAWQVLMGAAGGVVVGLIAHVAGASEETLKVLGYPGKLYINALMLVVVPYVCAAMFVSQRPDPSGQNSRGMGRLALMCYAVTTTTAVTVAIICVNIFGAAQGAAPPHANASTEATAGAAVAASAAAAMTPVSAIETALSIGEQLLPRNLLVTYTETNIVGLIVFFVLLGRAVSRCCGFLAVLAPWGGRGGGEGRSVRAHTHTRCTGHRMNDGRRQGLTYVNLSQNDRWRRRR
jgi:hypothetical protein